MDLLLPLLFAVFIWWFSTGLILLLDNLPRTTFRWSLVLSSLLGIGALVGLAHTAGGTRVADAYCAFTCALLAWGWHELSFLTGWITGPRRHAATPGARGWQRFSQAVAAILWHELGILAVGCVIVAITWEQPNQVGTWTFAVLWAMRTSAKLNLYLGVRNLSKEFLPPHLKYMGSHFRRRAMNGLFPVSVTVPTVVLVLMVSSAAAPGTGPATTVGLVLVSTMLGLAILEHWLLVLPLQATALWRWAMRGQAQRTATDTEPPPAILSAPHDESLLHAR